MATATKKKGKTRRADPPPEKARTPAGFGYLSLETALAYDRGDREVWARQLAVRNSGLRASDLSDAITALKLTDTMQGSSTMEVGIQDGQWDLLDSGFLDANANGRLNPIDCEYPKGSGVWWRLSQVQIRGIPAGGGAAMTLRFMERPAMHLMSHHGPLKTSRAKQTRAQFIKGLVETVGHKKGAKGMPIVFECHQLTTVQAIAGAGVAGSGFSPGAAHGHILNEGDSLATTAGSGGPLEKLNSKVDTSAAVSRTSSQGLADLKSKSKLPPTLVVQLGTNDTDVDVLRANVKAVLKLPGVKRVFWVNIAGTANDDSFNTMLDQQARANSKLNIVDWKHAVDSGRANLGGDVHPDAAGYDYRARLIQRALSGYGSDSGAASPGDPKHEKQPGVAKAAKLTIKGRPIDKDQRDNINICLKVAEELKAGELATLAMVLAGIGESSFHTNAEHPTSHAHGVFQLLPSTQSGTGIRWDETEKQCRHWFKTGYYSKGGGIALAKQGKSAGQIVVDVEGSGVSPTFYDNPSARKEAEAIIDAGGGVVTGDEAGDSFTPQYNFEVGTRGDPHEDFWTAINRLAKQVKWALFVDGQRIYYDSEMTLIRMEPAAVLERGDPALTSFSCNWDSRHIATEAEIQVVCDPFTFRAGEVIWLRGFGPASTGSTAGLPGRWLIAEISRDIFAATDTLRLKQPERPLPEPRNASRSRKDGEDTGDPGELGDLAGMTPKDIIDKFVVPLAKSNGMATGITPQMVEQANAAHSQMTTSGNVSMHKGPPSQQWAADMSNGTSPTPQMDQLADDIAELFGMPKINKKVKASDANCINKTVKGFKCQLIYRSYIGGDHTNHVHFGLRDVGGGSRSHQANPAPPTKGSRDSR